MPDNFITEPDVVLIGAGVMSSTLGVLLKELEPSLTIAMFETLEDCGLESSEAWNNAGTGHAANCEMNYTPERPDGSVDISKALEVNVEFDLSRQFWSYLVKKGAIADPRSFIHPVPHMSFVHGGNVSFLRKRFKAMSAHHLVRQLVGQPGCKVHYRHRVTNLVREENGRWRVEVHDLDSGKKRSVKTKFVFIGAGGGALPLLQKSDIPEGRGYVVASRSAASGYAATIPRSTSATTPRSTARRRWGRRRCRYLISTPGSLVASTRCCSVPMPASQVNF